MHKLSLARYISPFRRELSGVVNTLSLDGYACTTTTERLAIGRLHRHLNTYSLIGFFSENLLRLCAAGGISIQAEH